MNCRPTFLSGWRTATAVAAAACASCSGLLDLDVHYADASGDATNTAPPVDDGSAEGASASLEAGDDGSGPLASPDADLDAPGAPLDAQDASIDTSAPPDGGVVSSAIHYVQGTATQARMGTAVATIAFTGALAAHDTIVVGADFDTATTLAITDSLGNTYANAVERTSAGLTSLVYYALDVPAGPDTLTLTVTGGAPNAFEVYIHEYAGIAGLDVTAGATGTTASMTSGTATTTASGDLIFGFGVSGTVRVGSGFTSRSSFNSNLTEDEIVGAPAPRQATATSAGGSWTMLMAAFKSQ